MYIFITKASILDIFGFIFPFFYLILILVFIFFAVKLFIRLYKYLGTRIRQ